MIGDETLGMKGISGGQRRRVGIGLELVKDPRLVFLDEVVHQSAKTPLPVRDVM